MALKQNTWTLNQWYDQDVAGNVSYEGSLSGSLYLWGSGYYGAIGNNKADGHNPAPSVYVNSPTQVPGTWTNAMLACDGDNHNGGIKSDGTLWTWGDNYYGQLGINVSNPARRSSPVQVGSDTTWRKRSDTPGSNGVSGQGSFVGGNNACFAFKTDGTLWAWGVNEVGYLAQPGDNYSGSGSGPGPHHSSPVQIPGTTWKLVSGSSYYAAFGIKTDGTLWSWGKNDNGKLAQNNPSNNDRSSPVQIGSGSDWKTVLAQGGGDCVLATKTDGTLWGWGNNLRGNLGNNTSGPGSKYSSPVQCPGTTWDRPILAGGDVSLVIKTDGTLWGMGRNEVGELAQNNIVSYSSPVQVGSGTDWKDGAGKQGQVFATKTDGSLYAWGTNYQGSLGLSQSSLIRYSSPVQIPGTWISVHNWNAGGGGIK